MNDPGRQTPLDADPTPRQTPPNADPPDADPPLGRPVLDADPWEDPPSLLLWAVINVKERKDNFLIFVSVKVVYTVEFP